ncbi:MAG: HD domain-containing protein [Candidatus Pacearchaeota archaeon]|nr:HD domain-containing protein [Candidatus Pacearchaeota archaeon]
MITLKEVKENEEIKALIKAADFYLERMGFTEHGSRHAELCAERAKYILETLGYEKEKVELAAIASYLHDIGNVINRQDHSQSGALIALNVLRGLRMPLENIIKVMAAIGNHEETEAGLPITSIAAATIIADKSDVHRSRVKQREKSKFDIHDRVNYAVLDSELKVNKHTKIITLKLKIDTKFSAIMEYFEIFLKRMILMRHAAKTLKCKLELVINNTKML